MCCVLAWAGRLPKGLVTALLIEAQDRGKDSTGIAWVDGKTGQVFGVKDTLRATLFRDTHSDCLHVARNSRAGIAHTRRASPKMPIDANNAHPFAWQGVVYAHNGKIDNWEDVQKDLATKYPEEAVRIRGWKTDSMVLGPSIKTRNFHDVQGCMGLVWLDEGKVYFARSAKELEAATLTYTIDGKQRSVSLVASTTETITKALEKIAAKNKDFKQDELLFYTIQENMIYECAPDAVYEIGATPFNPKNHGDAFSSSKVETPTSTTPVLALETVKGELDEEDNFDNPVLRASKMEEQFYTVD
jgi:predicted glutamine amidotransferase